MGCSCATEEHSRGCIGGNLNTDFKLSEEERCRQSFTKEDDVISEGPTIAYLTVMAQQLRLENRHLENQLVERKIEVEELWDDLLLLRRGLSAKMKR